MIGEGPTRGVAGYVDLGDGSSTKPDVLIGDGRTRFRAVLRLRHQVEFGRVEIVSAWIGSFPAERLNLSAKAERSTHRRWPPSQPPSKALDHLPDPADPQNRPSFRRCLNRSRLRRLNNIAFALPRTPESVCPGHWLRRRSQAARCCR